MQDLKEITVFTIGNACELSAWSNVPYFFTKTLEEKNIRINRIDIEENAFINTLYRYSVFVLLKVFYRNSDHTYFRSGLNRFLTNRKIARAKKKHNHSQAFIFLTYSFGRKKNKNETLILFSDWSYLYKIKKLQNRQPYWFERNAILSEEKNILSADLVLSLFPGSLEFNQANYPKANCRYLGNVINSDGVADKASLLSQKLKSNIILFIGNIKYLQGALDLIAAFKQLRNTHPGLELHLIGLKAPETQVEAAGLFYHGYLDKGDREQNNTYYQLLASAKCIVNTTKGWGAFSAMTEAMYYYTPVITTAYPEFVKTYGASIAFGRYVTNEQEDELANALERMIVDHGENYVKMAEAAHDKVKAFSWPAYIEKLLPLISGKQPAA